MYKHRRTLSADGPRCLYMGEEIPPCQEAYIRLRLDLDYPSISFISSSESISMPCPMSTDSATSRSLMRSTT